MGIGQRQSAKLKSKGKGTRQDKTRLDREEEGGRREQGVGMREEVEEST